MIYITYFRQNEWKTLGIRSDCYLASALQNKYRAAESDILAFNWIIKHDGIISRKAFEFIKKYSTATNL